MTFQDDDLDQNDELEVNLRRRFEFLVAGNAPVAKTTLPGNHLTPVFFRFDGAKLSPAFAKLGGLSVGDEEAVTRLAELAFLWCRQRPWRCFQGSFLWIATVKPKSN